MTTPRPYEAEILAALGIESPRNSVAAVKDLVIKEFEALDSRTKCKSTEYFNHTFAPDLVLSWPNDATVNDRYVYLRFNDDIAYLTDGLDRLQGVEPIVFGLTATPHDEPDEIAHLRTTASERRTLVTDPAAVSTFISRRSTTPVLGLLSTALAQGGRGLVDSDDAQRATDIVADGFTGAREVDADATSGAARLISSLLNERQTGRMSRFLQAVWVGSGGRIDLFPGTQSLVGDITDEALQFLLDFDEINDAEFWQRLGRGVTVKQLCTLHVSDPCINLQHLIRSNIDRLWARACAVVADPARLEEVSDAIPWRWVLERRLLGLRGPDFTAYAAETATEARNAISGNPGPGLEVEDLRTRAVGTVLNSLRLGDGREALSLNSESDADVVQGERLSTLFAAFGADAKVQEATATLASGQHINLDFRTLTASGVTSTQPLLGDLLVTAVPLLWSLGGQAIQDLMGLLAVPPELVEWTLDFDEANEDD